MIKYFNDGANWQAQAIVCYLQTKNIESSWSSEYKRYMAEPNIARWYNCREQGYVIYMRSENCSKQINIAFFEHRNSDSISAIEWEECSINPLTVDNANLGNIYKDKWDTSFSVDYKYITEMGDWIVKELEIFWNKNKNNADKGE